MQLTKKDNKTLIKVACNLLEAMPEILVKGCSIRELIVELTEALAQLETGMQSVSERYIDIPIEQPTVNELSQVKPSIWQPIESAPINKYILISGGLTSVPWDAAHWFEEANDTVRVARKISRYFEGEDNGYKYQPTHWQPLPPAPTIGVEE